jgi:hypothetical protein
MEKRCIGQGKIRLCKYEKERVSWERWKEIEGVESGQLILEFAVGGGKIPL